MLPDRALKSRIEEKRHRVCPLRACTDTVRGSFVLPPSSLHHVAHIDHERVGMGLAAIHSASQLQDPRHRPSTRSETPVIGMCQLLTCIRARVVEDAKGVNGLGWQNLEVKCLAQARETCHPA